MTGFFCILRETTKHTEMERSVILPVKDIVQYLDSLEHYFGIYDPHLLLARSSFKENPESKIEIVERVTAEQIEKHLLHEFPEIEKSVKADIIPLLWLVANTYHHKMIIEYEKFFVDWKKSSHSSFMVYSVTNL